MSFDVQLEAARQLTARDLDAVHAWFSQVKDAVVYTNDSVTFYLFNDEDERDRRLEGWRKHPSRNDYLTSFIVVNRTGAILSLVEDDVDKVAVDFASWWLKEIGGRLLDRGGVITPKDLIYDE